MLDREKAEEWASDFKAYVDELDIARDAYRGIMEYIDDALALLKEQEPEPAVPYSYLDAVGIVYGFKCPKCNSEIHEFQQYCDVCGRKVKWDEAD